MFHLWLTAVQLTLSSLSPAMGASRSPFPAPIAQEAAALLTDPPQAADSALTFVSAESTLVSQMPITNRIWLRQTPAFDVWFMRQKQRQQEGDEANRWSFVAIVVDQRHKPATAYYFEFAPQAVAGGAAPTLIQPRVPCFRCHPSGPRLIRPKANELTQAWTPSDWQRLKTWNQRIATMGDVATYESAATHLRLSDAKANEELTLPYCAGCHHRGSPVRGPLLRQHADSVLYLISHGATNAGTMAPVALGPEAAMPMADHLSRAETTCVVAWAAAKPLGPECSAEADAGPTQTAAHQAPSLSWHVDQEHSNLAVQVSTNLSQFNIGHLKVQGGVSHRAQSACQLQLQMDLSGLTTGIRARDRHLQSLLFPTGTARTVAVSAAVPCAVLAGPQTSFPIELTATVTMPDSAHAPIPIPVQAVCSNASRKLVCTGLHAKISLPSLGVEPPAFLALRVLPDVELTGQLVFATSELAAENFQ